ncbi:MAG: glycosyltransferase family 2 protein [Kiritimatiellae bacterium]|nr:glycosyltransferase family 2 protein [Kiritimatiellia bacterium]
MTEDVLFCIRTPLDFLCIGAGVVFLWSTLILFVGLLIRPRIHPGADRKLRFAILICARNEERVIRLPVKSILMSSYPRDRYEVIVLADNCTDGTAQKARAAGATVWEKTIPSSGKGDVLEWGIGKLLERRGDFDAVAVFDADNIVSARWLDAMNDALNDGEVLVTGRRMSSNATANVISGWYTVYWDLMNELSNRTRTNLGLSGKLTGTGFAFLFDILGDRGWHTHTMVEDVEFSIQSNIAGRRVAYVKDAEYADEQPVTVLHMWRQLCRWATGCWQVVRRYFWQWIVAMCRRPSVRLFDSFFALLTGMSVSFFMFFGLAAVFVHLAVGEGVLAALRVFGSFLFFVVGVGGIAGVFAVLLSSRKRRPRWWAVLTFPVFSIILASTVLWTLVRPTRKWKPIPHKGVEGRGGAS